MEYHVRGDVTGSFPVHFPMPNSRIGGLLHYPQKSAAVRDGKYQPVKRRFTKIQNLIFVNGCFWH
jgi:hypothetical protein